MRRRDRPPVHAGKIADVASTQRPRQLLRYLYASPFSMPPLDVGAELAVLRDTLASVCDVQPEVASISALGQAVVDPNAWLHISAHSAGHGSFLVLEDEESLGDTERPLPLGGLQSYIQVGGGARCSFLFLSACESGKLARVFFDNGVQNVVFCPTEVHDRRARRFAHTLYTGLGTGQPLERAFAQATVAAKLSGDEAQYGILTSGPLELPPRISCDSFSLPPCTAAPLRRGAARRRVEDFVGRKEAIRAVMCYLTGKRSFVLIHCLESLGRSATLREIAHLLTTPGRRLAGESLCAFFPAEAPGGLLIVDDVDCLNGEEHAQVKGHLEVDGAQVLACSRQGHSGSPYADLCKSMPVELKPLADEEAAELFLRRCQRPLQVSDVLPPQRREGRHPGEVLGKSEALRLLMKPIKAFKGVPGRIRTVVDEWAMSGSPSLGGEVERLAHAALLPSLKRCACAGQHRKGAAAEPPGVSAPPRRRHIDSVALWRR